MADSKCCSRCETVKPLEEFAKRPSAPDGYRGMCLVCWRKYQRDWYEKKQGPGSEPAPVRDPAQRWPSVEEFDASELPTEAVPVGFQIRTLSTEVDGEGNPLTQWIGARTAINETSEEIQAAIPVGHRLKGVSTLLDESGNVRAQWVKTALDGPEDRYGALLAALATVADAWQGKAEPIEAPMQFLDEDLLCVYPMGDPHLGMLAWPAETGNKFDLTIAERNLYAAVDHLVSLAPPAKQAIVMNLGDFFHSDNKAGTTTRGTQVDVDGRWPKVLSVGIRVMRRLIDRALEKHAHVTVINEIGNHDDHTSIMLSIALAQFYENEPRVTIDTSPEPFHWFRFGKCFIGVHHGDKTKKADLMGVMAVDRAKDWGETRHRYFYIGHVHHDSLKELHGVTVESFRTLAGKDAWHNGQGYRSGRDMKMDVLHREFGKVNRHIVGIDQIYSLLDQERDY